jgi:hypothetical protein
MFCARDWRALIGSFPHTTQTHKRTHGLVAMLNPCLAPSNDNDRARAVGKTPKKDAGEATEVEDVESRPYEELIAKKLTKRLYKV